MYWNTVISEGACSSGPVSHLIGVYKQAHTLFSDKLLQHPSASSSNRIPVSVSLIPAKMIKDSSSQLAPWVSQNTGYKQYDFSCLFLFFFYLCIAIYCSSVACPYLLTRGLCCKNTLKIETSDTTGVDGNIVLWNQHLSWLVICMMNWIKCLNKEDSAVGHHEWYL